MTNFHTTPRIRRIALISAAALLLAGAFFITTGPFSVGALERRLEANAEAALAMRGHDWASVRFDGQHAVVTGAAPSDVARADALATVASSTWSGGRIAGGVTRVTDETVEARFERGFVFRADAAMNGRVLIRGDATDARARDAIERYAATNFPNGADADLTLVPGGSASPDWQDAATRLLGQLARLDRGSIVLQGETGALFGEAANPQIAQSVAAALAAMPEPYRAAWLVTPAGAPPVVRIPDVEACAAVIRAAQGTETFRFEREGPEPSPLTAAALRRVGRSFAACPSGAALEIGVLREAQRAGLDAERLDEVRVLVGQGVTENPRISVRLVQDQDGAITFAISTLEE